MASGQDSSRCPVERAGVAALIGLCAVLEGHLSGDRDLLSHLSRQLGRRLAEDGVAPVDPDERAVRQAINELNQRLSYALGEYADPPTPGPVPA